MILDWNRWHGRAEANAAALREALIEAGDEVRLLTSSAGTAGDGKADYVAFGTETAAAQAFPQIANPFAAATVRKAIADFRPDIAWVNMFAHHLSPSVLTALGSTPAVLMVSGYKLMCPIGSKLLPDGTLCGDQAGWVCHRAGCVGLPHWLRDQVRYAAIRRAVRPVRRIVACSEWLRQELQKTGWQAETLLLPTSAPATYERRPTPDPSFFYFGRLDREKGVALLLRAFARLPAAATLRIAGQGPLREELEELAGTLGISERVAFPGWLDLQAIERELSNAWAAVVPSLWPEPQGLVAIEATVRGVPVIASQAGGLGEIVEGGITGLRFPNGDEEGLVECPRMIAERRAFPDQRVAAAAVRRVAELFSVETNVAHWRRIFREVIGD